jgi:hypothetical protein
VQENAHRCDVASVVAWLVDGARSGAQADEVLTQLCERLVACGIPLWRVAVFVWTLTSWDAGSCGGWAKARTSRQRPMRARIPRSSGKAP